MMTTPNGDRAAMSLDSQSKSLYSTRTGTGTGSVFGSGTVFGFGTGTVIGSVFGTGTGARTCAGDIAGM